MDCVEVCPVDCFYEGENMLVIHPDECIDCGVCVPECPVDAIKPDTDPGLEEWLSLNAKYAKIWPNITVKKTPRPTPKSGRASQINCNTSHQIPVWVIKAVNACAASMPAPARFSNLQCPPFAPESEHPAYAPQGRKLNFKTARGLSVPSTDFLAARTQWLSNPAKPRQQSRLLPLFPRRFPDNFPGKHSAPENARNPRFYYISATCLIRRVNAFYTLSRL